MKLSCKSEIIEADNIIQTSKVITDMIGDCQLCDTPIHIPDEYYQSLSKGVSDRDQLILVLISVTIVIEDHLATFTDQNSVKNTGNFKAGSGSTGSGSTGSASTGSGSTGSASTGLAITSDELTEPISIRPGGIDMVHFVGKYEEIKSYIIEIINDKISLLRLYNFLYVDEKYINTLARQTGIILEQCNILFEIPFDILTLIVTNFPSLYLDQRYKNVGLSEDLRSDIVNNPRKYESVYYRGKYNSCIHNDEYIKAGNPNIIEYCVTAAIKNIPNNASGSAASQPRKVCIDLTGLMG